VNPSVDTYLEDGCGRCPLGGTPECKVNPWRPALKSVRSVLLDCGLTEELKWRIPCYTFENRNIVLLAAFKDYCAVSFFKGALLKDPAGFLIKPGKNSQAVRQFRITGSRQINEMAATLKAYVMEAIEVERAGLKVDFTAKNELVLPEEFRQKLDEDPVLKAAFEGLTPGRQRGYNLYFSGAKQSKTRVARIEKCRQRILEGKGIHDR
jgi:uncharacterized protein YdeI (YjbR/CyaY-like superfamily)